MMTGVIILAAGMSSRMGRPKQLLQYGGRSFISRIIQEGLQHPVVVVLGAYHEEIAAEIAGFDITVVVNEAWQTGMAGSVSAGVNTLLALHPEVAQAILVVADQPYVTAGLLQTMIHCKTKGIVACAYSGITGTPVLFDRKYFPDLLELTGEEGAKRVVRKYMDDMETVPFEQGAVDIDTAADFEQLPRNIVQVFFFGRLTAVTLVQSVTVTDVADTATLQRMMVEQYPALQGLNYILAVDRKVIAGNVALSDGQTVAFMPPFSGG